LAVRFVAAAILFAKVVRLQKRLAWDGGVRVRRDGHGGAVPNFLRARGDLIPAVVPLAF
jgi:hypothetical protein